MERVVLSEGTAVPYGPGTLCTAEEGKTRQSEAQGADINWIVRKYEETGVLPVNQREGYFADMSAFPTFQEALAHVEAARSYFMSLPPVVRAKFDNSAVRFLDAWNAGEMSEVFQEIGLLDVVPVEPAVAPVEQEQARSADGRFTTGLEPKAI